MPEIQRGFYALDMPEMLKGFYTLDEFPKPVLVFVKNFKEETLWHYNYRTFMGTCERYGLSSIVVDEAIHKMEDSQRMLIIDVDKAKAW